MDNSAHEIGRGSVDLTTVPLSALDSLAEIELAQSTERLLSQIDHPSSSVGGHNS